MSALSIEDLPPVNGFCLGQISRQGRSCETEEEARREDACRLRLLTASAQQATKSINREACEKLARLLDYDDGPPPRTMASKLYARSMRELVIGHLGRLLDANSFPIATVHLEPERQELWGSSLCNLDPTAENHALRSALNEVGFAQLQGAAILFQDVEYEKNSDVWRGGKHGLVFGQKVEAFERLRSTRNYKPRLQEGSIRCSPRIRIIKNLRDLDYHLTYLFKVGIYGRWEGVVDGRRVRSRKQRVPGHRHSQALLWLHDQRPSDLCQLLALKIGREGIFFTNGGGD